MLKRLLCMLLSFSLLLNCAFSQNDNIPTIKLKLERFRKGYPQEKIHLHLDKPYYSIGDTIYFKAYIVNAEKNLPSVISNIIYTDLIDENNNIQKTIRRPVTDGFAWGTIALSDSLPEGYYRIRSYTNWMRNFDDACFFNQVIAIGNALTNDIITNAAFKLDAKENKNEDSASVSFKSLHGNNLAGKEVVYNIFINKKEVQAGKSRTNNEGKINIGFAGTHLHNNQPAELVTHIRIDNKTTVTKTIKFNLPSVKHIIQFFPEGGQTVSGFPSRIGFKALGSDGFGTDVSGEVADETSSRIVVFKSGFAGIGSFQFTPQPAHSYHALLHYHDGSEEKADLPKAEEYGYVLDIDNADSEQVKINIFSKQTTVTTDVTIAAQCNNRIQYIARLTLNNGTASATVSKKKFPTGIVQFTVFDLTAQPVAERLIFINHNDQTGINISLDKKSYGKRENVSMNITAKDNKGNPVSGNFSIAVTDGNAVAADKMNKQSILSDLLLTSDLRGYIENPNYYFTGINNKKSEELDNLLLTQGWRRFVWKDILEDKFPSAKFAAEKNLTISGKVLSTKGEPAAAAKVTLLSKKINNYILDTLTSASGDFAFDDLDFEDDKPFVVQAIKSDGSRNVQVKLNDVSPPRVSNNKNLSEVKPGDASVLETYLSQSAYRFDEMRKNGLLQNYHILKEVTVTTKQLTKVQEAVAPSYNLNGPGNADQILTYEDIKNCYDLARCLPGKMTGVRIEPYKDPVTKVITMQAFSTRSMSSAPMLLIVDGAYMNTSFSLSSLDASAVQSIEVLRSGGYLNVYGLQASNGVLVITTKQGNIDYEGIEEAKKQIKELKGIIFTTAKGYDVYRQFYSPDYSSHQVNNGMPDLRSTIYWKPNVVTNEDGNATINFYNADNAAAYNVIIEGISNDGKPGKAFSTYEVK